MAARAVLQAGRIAELGRDQPELLGAHRRTSGRNHRQSNAFVEKRFF